MQIMIMRAETGSNIEVKGPFINYTTQFGGGGESSFV